jgi:hypothetical protein
MKNLKARIARLEMAKKNSKQKKIIVISTEPGREDHDLKKAKEKHGEKPHLRYIRTYVPSPAPCPKGLKNEGISCPDLCLTLQD